jgi:hypothetical protein
MIRLNRCSAQSGPADSFGEMCLTDDFEKKQRPSGALVQTFFMSAVATQEW